MCSQSQNKVRNESPHDGGFRLSERRLKKQFLRPIRRYLTYALARQYRSVVGLFGNTRFIAIAGSCGKTTTTEMISAILEKGGPVQKGSHENTPIYIAQTILSVTRQHRFCVSEVSEDKIGQIERAARMLKPHIAVITNIGQDHYGRYRSLEETAAETGNLPQALSADGTAVLNRDDPRVFEMRKRTKAHVLTYGVSPHAMVRGERICSIWPKTMSLDIRIEQSCYPVQTRLPGAHWAYTVLAALAAAIAAGISPERAIQAIEAFEPIPYRMYPHKMPDGVTFICDNWKSTLWMIPASMDFMRKATARRKIAVIGSITSTPKGFYDRYKAVIQQASDAVDILIFTGEHAHHALRIPGLKGERIMAFDTLRQLHSFLQEYLNAGDLVLLKGDEHHDHLQRIVHTRAKPIACWQENCGKRRFCSDCRDLYGDSRSSPL